MTGDDLSSAKLIESAVEPGEILASLSRLTEQAERQSEATRARGGEDETQELNDIADDAELLQDFIQESREHLTKVEQNLLKLEKTPDESEAIHATFRSFHTIKGLAGFLGFNAIQEVSHETETLLDLARSFIIPVTVPIIDVVLRAADFLKDSLDRVGNKEKLKVRAPKDLLLSLQAAAGGKSADSLALQCPVPSMAEANRREVSDVADIEKARNAQALSGALKVDADKIEHLIDMVGELVIAQSMVRQNPALSGIGDSVLARNLAQLTRVTAEVQKTAMSMRMAPVSGLFQKVERLVRDVARKSGKQVNLEVSGEGAEMDRKILDGLAEPLVHMVRNAVDHGLEQPAERAASGKNPVGVIRLRAERESGNIVIEISDDGRGLNAEKIRQKAIERGLVSPHARLSLEDVHLLIFEPGFSTADQVTEFSGRGVGMDVVRKQVERLRGRVEIRSVQAKGTTFTVRVPLTLAMVDGLLIRVGAERYVLPTFVVREIFRVQPDGIFTIGGRSEMVKFRESTIPVVRLASRLQTGAVVESDTASIMIVVQNGPRQVCLVADEVIGKQEVVIKSLGSCFQNQAGIAGGAILGDGRVGLILDLDGLLDTRHALVAGQESL